MMPSCGVARGPRAAPPQNLRSSTAPAVLRELTTVETAGPIHGGPQNVLVVGASGDYGLSSRIVSAFGMGARTIGLSYEREPAEDKSASAGWYNNAAFDRAAAARGLYSTSVNADAFADTTKAQIGDLLPHSFSLAI